MMIYISEQSSGKKTQIAALAEQYDHGGDDDNHNDYDDDTNINNNANIYITKTDISFNIIFDADDSVLIVCRFSRTIPVTEHSPHYEINQN